VRLLETRLVVRPGYEGEQLSVHHGESYSEVVTFDIFDKILYVMLFPRVLIYPEECALPKWWD
jgi:hypothetical protein